MARIMQQHMQRADQAAEMYEVLRIWSSGRCSKQGRCHWLLISCHSLCSSMWLAEDCEGAHVQLDCRTGCVLRTGCDSALSMPVAWKLSECLCRAGKEEPLFLR
jgi:hypothetical protein